MSEVTFLEVGLLSQEARETMRRDGDHGNKVGVGSQRMVGPLRETRDEKWDDERE